MLKGLNSSKNLIMPLTLGECDTDGVLDRGETSGPGGAGGTINESRVCVCVSWIFHLFTLTMIHTENRNFEQHFGFL